MRVADFVTMNQRGGSNFPIEAPSNAIGPQRLSGPMVRMNPRTARTSSMFHGTGRGLGAIDKAKTWTFASLAAEGAIGKGMSCAEMQPVIGTAVAIRRGEFGWTGKITDAQGVVQTKDSAVVNVLGFATGGASSDSTDMRCAVHLDSLLEITGLPEDADGPAGHTKTTSWVAIDTVVPPFYKTGWGMLAIAGGAYAFWKWFL